MPANSRAILIFFSDVSVEHKPTSMMSSPSKPVESEDNIFSKLERLITTSKCITFSDHRYLKELDCEPCEVPRKKRKKEAILDKLPFLEKLKYFDLLLIDRVKPIKAMLPKQAKGKTRVTKLVERSSNCHDTVADRKTTHKSASDKNSILRTDETSAHKKLRLHDVDTGENIPLAIYKVTSHGSGLKLRMQRKRTSSDGSSVNSEQYDDSWDSDAPSTESSDGSSCRETSTANSEVNSYSSRSRRILRRRCPCCR